MVFVDICLKFKNTACSKWRIQDGGLTSYCLVKSLFTVRLLTLIQNGAFTIWRLLTFVQNLKLPPIENGGFKMAA